MGTLCNLTGATLGAALAFLVAVTFLPRLVGRLRQRPWLTVEEIKRRLDAGQDLLAMDVRTAANRVLREQWVAVCTDCHEEGRKRDWLADLGRERRSAWKQLYAAEDISRDLRADNVLHPRPGQRPPYPVDTLERLWSRARIGFLEGQASAFCNVSASSGTISRWGISTASERTRPPPTMTRRGWSAAIPPWRAGGGGAGS